MAKKQITTIMKWIFLHRKYILILWWFFLLILWYLFIFYKDLYFHSFQSFFLLYPLLWYVIYFIIVSLRWLTFIPLTTLLIVMIPFTNHWILLIVTLVGTLITSYLIYRFSAALDIDDYFERKHPRAIKRLRRWFEKYEFPIIVWRSLFPFTPTDLICYIAGTLKVNVHKMLLGVLIGETVICGFYIWGIHSLIS